MANAWYRSGTVSVTNGSPTVIGSGTLFTGNINAGDIFFGPDGIQYEVNSVSDNTTITIRQKDGTAAYLGSTLSGQAYSIVKTGPNNATLTTQLTTLATNWQQDRDQYATWLGGTATGGDGSGNYPLTDALGVSRNVACPAKLASVAASGVLTGFVAGSGVPMATDTILQAIQKLTGGPGSTQAFSVGPLTATSVGIIRASGGNLFGFSSTGNTPYGLISDGTYQVTFGVDSTNPTGGATFINASNGMRLMVNSSAVASVTAAGLAVTGGISATSKAVLGDGFTITAGSNTNAIAANTFITQFEAANILRSYLCGADGSTRAKWEIYTALSTGTPVKALEISSTGVAVTGNITSAQSTANLANNSMLAYSNGYCYIAGNTNGLILAANAASDTRVSIKNDNTITMGIAGTGVVATVSATGLLAVGQSSAQKDVTDAAAGQIMVYGASNSNQRLSMGYHTSSNYGFIQANLASVACQKLALNPLGGTVLVGTATVSSGATLEVAGSISSTSGITDTGTGITAWGSFFSDNLQMRTNSALAFKNGVGTEMANFNHTTGKLTLNYDLVAGASIKINSAGKGLFWGGGGTAFYGNDTGGAQYLKADVAGTTVLNVTSTGLAVTGRISSTGLLDLPQFASNPAGAVEGSVYMNTTDHKPYVWTGSSWAALY